MKKTTMMLHYDYDHTGICRYLEEEARQGWLLEDMNWGWHFRSAPPQEVRYAVTYYKDGDPYDPPEGQKDYFDLCAAVGWELVAQHGTMQIFRTTDPRAVPIETEPAVQVENVHRAMKSRLLNRSFYLMAIASNLFFRVRMHMRYLSASDQPALLWANLLLLVGIVFYVAPELLTYYHWHVRARRAAQMEGRFLPSYGIRWLEAASFAALYAFTVFFAFEVGGALVWGITLLATLLILCDFVSNAVKNRLALEGREVTGFLGERTVSVTVVILAALFAVILIGLYQQNNHQEETLQRIQEEIIWSGNISAAPLTPKDLGGWGDENFELKHSEGNTSPLNYESYTFRTAEGAAADAPETMTYTTWSGDAKDLRDRQSQTRTQLFYSIEQAKEELLSPGEGAYPDVMHIDCGETHSYLYCDGTALVEMKFSWALTEEQLLTALDALSKN